MDAPFWEMAVRIMTVMVAGFAFASVFTLLRIHLQNKNPVRYLTAYMTFVIFSLFVDRAYIVWVGLQHDADGSYAVNTEPVVRAVGAALLALLLLGSAFVAVYHIKHRRRVEDE